MWGWLARIFRRTRPPVPGEGSGATARQRLQVVLVHDRLGLAPQVIEQMREEILRIVARYLEVEDGAQVEVQRRGEQVVLLANIPVRDVARAGTS